MKNSVECNNDGKEIDENEVVNDRLKRLNKKYINSTDKVSIDGQLEHGQSHFGEQDWTQRCVCQFDTSHKFKSESVEKY